MMFGTSLYVYWSALYLLLILARFGIGLMFETSFAAAGMGYRTAGVHYPNPIIHAVSFNRFKVHATPNFFPS